MTHLERLAKSYEVDNFFEYIVESQINGNISQVRELAKKLKRNELVMFCNYALSGFYGKYGREAVRTLMGD